MPVILRTMTSEEFQFFRRWSIAHQAEELAEERHMPQEQAAKEAACELAQMLPDGLNTACNHLMAIEETDLGENVGFLWILHEEYEGRKQSFLCDFAIWEHHRRKGYAAAALQLAEGLAAEAGCEESVLFVADRNIAAETLYRKCGYRFLRQADCGKYMIKQLG